VAYSKGDDEAAKKSDAEIQEEVKQSIQKMVDQAVDAFSVSPMEDPDYKPEDEGMNEDVELVVVGQGYDIEVEERPWREQLLEALDQVRELGKVDGEAFAEMVCETFYELNGSEPSFDQLTNLYSRIRTDFGDEAEEELEDESESESEAEIESDSENEVESDSEEEVDFGDEWEDVLEHVCKIGRKDGRSLAHSICDLFADVNGSEPSLEELHEVWQSIQDGLAEEAQNVDETEDSTSIDVDSESDWESASDEEGAYDPNNVADQMMAKKDASEDRKHEVEHFEQMVLNTPMVTGKRGGGVSWSMYFDESELNEEAENSNLVKTVEGFKMMNGREPTRLEVHKMKLFLSVPNELMDAEEEIVGTSIMLKSPMLTSQRGGGASWTVYFDEARGSLKKAKRAFLKMNNREPTTFELQQLRSFLAVPKELDMDGDNDDDTDLEQKGARTPSKVLVSPVQDKKTAKRFNVYLEDSKLSQKETEQIAVKWFNRFNKREPSKEELAKIQAFISKDADLMEQEFLVPVKSLNFDAADDDEKDVDPSAYVKSTTKAVTKKKTATGYTLNFEDDEKDGDEEEAIQWFKRFNHREPSKEERQQIQQFMKADDLEKAEQEQDDEEMIDIE